MFKYAELNEVLKQNDKLTINILSKVPVGSIDDHVEKLLKVRFIHEIDKNYPKNVLHIYPEKRMNLL